MASVIEEAKSGRATCRTCRKGIGKGELRFGEEVPAAFGDGTGTTRLWHHLACAAKKKPTQLSEALVSFVGEVPGRAEIEALVAENEPKQKPTRFPYAERATTARSRCGTCHEGIDKGDLRVAFEREPDPGGMTMGAARYFHARCAPGREQLFDALRDNSKGLSPGDLADLEQALATPG
jgi:Poly(ADP-ribose) polymerase and DNA-Ligase Zn-finger region